MLTGSLGARLCDKVQSSSSKRFETKTFWFWESRTIQVLLSPAFQGTIWQLWNLKQHNCYKQYKDWFGNWNSLIVVSSCKYDRCIPLFQRNHSKWKNIDYEAWFEASSKTIYSRYITTKEAMMLQDFNVFLKITFKTRRVFEYMLVIKPIFSLDTGRHLNVHKTFRRHLGRLWTSYICSTYVLCPEG